MDPIRLATVLTLLVVSGCSASGPGATPAPDQSPTSPTTPPSQDTVPSPTLSPTLSAAEQERLDRRLLDAAWADDVATAERLIAQGADVNWRDETVQSAFLVATSEGYLELLELTLRHGADVDLHDSFDGTGLIRAAERGHWHVVGRLLQTPMEVDHVNNLGWVALHEAIILGDGSQRYVDTVRALVAGGADLEIESRNDGVAPLEHARAKGQDAVVTTLERALGSRPGSLADRELLAAAASGDADGVALALRDGADLEARDGRGRTPLLIALTRDRPDAARLLAAMGADPAVTDRAGVSALQHARDRRLAEVTRVLQVGTA